MYLGYGNLMDSRFSRFDGSIGGWFIVKFWFKTPQISRYTR
jgi:hypothetical protein